MKYFFYLLLVLVVFAGCKKAKENKIIGRWELLPQFAEDTLIKQVYEFDAANTVYRYKNDSLTDTASYTIIQEFNKFYVDLTAMDVYNDGHYYIEKINKEVLILQCFSPFLRKEFVKAE
jgi:hypothetical protein